MSNEIQQGLQDDLTTIEPDLMNMTRLFGMPDSVWDAPEYHFAAAIEGGQYVIRFYGKTQAAQGVTDIPSDADARIQALHRRRALRRLCRQTLYDLLRKETGIHPPWGSMTGIRPTHLMYEALNEGMSMADAQKHLVHQFDVAPEKAALLAELVSVQQQLPPPGDDWMDVYIGIPFCTTRCTYCSFSSGELGDGHLVAPYLTALFREMEACAQLLRDAGKKLRAVYVGGGTPTSLNEEQLPRLLEKMMQCFPCAMEYTVEAGRPDTLTLPKLEAIRRAGVQRISINPQTMNDKTLRVIGRAHTAQQVEEAYAMARTAKIHHINMDVIAGLPGENIDDFARTMDAALRLTPESLTEGAVGMELLQAAMGYHLGQFGVIFIAATLWLFSFSTFLGILYYARSNISYLFGDGMLPQNLYKVLALVMMFIGGLAAYTVVWDLGDVGVGLMTVFNIIMLYPMSGIAMKALKSYETEKKNRKKG